MTLRLDMITIDSADPGPLARWWAEQTGGTPEEFDGGQFFTVSLPQLRLAFQQVAAPTPGKNRVHLDFESSDLDAEVARLVGAGAFEIDRHTNGDFRWATLSDPDGNVFCVAAGS